MQEILTWDAYLIHQVAYALNDRIRGPDPDPAFMYTYGEYPSKKLVFDRWSSVRYAQ
jgi:hypothetical protein